MVIVEVNCPQPSWFQGYLSYICQYAKMLNVIHICELIRQVYQIYQFQAQGPCCIYNLPCANLSCFTLSLLFMQTDTNIFCDMANLDMLIYNVTSELVKVTDRFIVYSSDVSVILQLSNSFDNYFTLHSHGYNTRHTVALVLFSCSHNKIIFIGPATQNAVPNSMKDSCSVPPFSSNATESPRVIVHVISPSYFWHSIYFPKFSSFSNLSVLFKRILISGYFCLFVLFYGVPYYVGIRTVTTAAFLCFPFKTTIYLSSHCFFLVFH